MAKTFERRVLKKDRKKIEVPKSLLDKNLFELSDNKLLRGALLEKVQLKDIVVREQVRTKFNDSSLKSLADNIKVNGLIQPLVIHREGKKFVLICGERRFRAMNLIKFKEAPCFILENKNADELMAIQFSENSSREDLHYIDKADGILNYQNTTGHSERKIQKALGISKTEVHRSLIIAKSPRKLKEACKAFNIEKYVLLEFQSIEERSIKKIAEKEILEGRILKRSQLKTFLRKNTSYEPKTSRSKSATKTTLDKRTEEIIKALKTKDKNLKLNKSTKKLLESLLDN